MSLEVYVNRTIKNCKSCTVFKSVDDDPEIEEPFALTTLKAGKNILGTIRNTTNAKLAKEKVIFCQL